jgi:glycosyltransferase involved in cell wall biosynthesis
VVSDPIRQSDLWQKKRIATQKANMINILYLYSELCPYNIPVLTCLARDYGAELHVVSHDTHRLKPYQPPPIEHVTYYKRSSFTSAQLLKLAQGIEPDLIYVSGWMDKGYLPTTKKYKKMGIPVVTGFDDQWLGTLRQRLGVIAFRVYYKSFFSHAWVAGPRQYEFARRLGFTSREIIFDLLTCDTSMFATAAATRLKNKNGYPKTFLYVGNFRTVKGTDLLVKAFATYRDKFGGDWRLICVGCGDLRPLLMSQKNVEVYDFMEQESLGNLCAQAGVFVLPSRLDQWGVVVHEFVTAGLPLLLSKNVGAKDVFFIEGFNGMSYSENSSDCLAQGMLAMSKKSAEELYAMGENSVRLASRINPLMSAANLMSVIM